jgi:hypothetical protein
MLAPAIGAAMTELILDGTARHVDVAPFALARPLARLARNQRAELVELSVIWVEVQ